MHVGEDRETPAFSPSSSASSMENIPKIGDDNENELALSEEVDRAPASLALSDDCRQKEESTDHIAMDDLDDVC